MNKEFERWLNSDKLDDNSKKRLQEIANDETAIAERFAIPMSFGTAGLRSTMDVGISKMNVYTVAQTTQGLADLVISANGCERGVAVCYDSRNDSDTFAKTAASVLTANGIDHWTIRAEADITKCIETLLDTPLAKKGSIRDRYFKAAWRHHIGGEQDEE